MVKNQYGWDGYDLLDDYVTLESAAFKPEEWGTCPKCEAKPKVWLFDNGRYAACKCFTFYGQKVKSESVNSAAYRDDMRNFDNDELRNNWNNYLKNGNMIIYKDGRW